MRNERQWIRQIIQGNRQAYAQFVDAYGPCVHRLVRRYVPTEADAEDLTQEIFVDLYRSLPRFRGEAALGTWVYRVALNHCLKHVERRGPVLMSYDEALQAAAAPSPCPSQCAVRTEMAEQIQTALDGLTALHREVVILHELHGLTYGECAQALGIPIGTVKSRLSAAFRRLRESLGDYVSSLESV